MTRYLQLLLKLKQEITPALIILLLSSTFVGMTTYAQPTYHSARNVDLISAFSDKLIYDQGEDIRFNVVISNNGSSVLRDTSLHASITVQGSLAAPQKIQVANNLTLVASEDRILNNLYLWQTPIMKNSRVYDVSLELKDSLGKTLVRKPNMLTFKVQSIAPLDDEVPPTATITHTPEQPKLNGTMKFSISATDETSISQVILYLDNYKINTWVPKTNSFSVNQTVTKLAAGVHHFRLEVHDSTNVSMLQDSVFIPPPPPYTCPKKSRLAEYTGCTPPLLVEPFTLDIKTVPPLEMINIRIDDVDFFTESDGMLSVRLMPGKHFIEIINDSVNINDLERAVFKLWSGEFRASPGQRKIQLDVSEFQAHMQSTISIAAEFYRQYRMQFTSAGLPDGADVNLTVDATGYKNWFSPYKTPFNFVTPDWLEPSSLRFSIEPSRVKVGGDSYSFSHWQFDDGKVVSYNTNNKITFQPARLIAVYKPFSTQPHIPLLNILPLNSTQVSSVPVDFIASFASPTVGSVVQFYLDDEPIGTSKTNEQGYAVLSMRHKLTEGDHQWHASSMNDSGGEVRSPTWTFSYKDIKIAEIKSVVISDPSPAPGQTLSMDLEIKVTDILAAGTLKLRSSMYDVDDAIISSDVIYQVALRKSTQLTLDDLYFWQIPADSEPGTYGIVLELTNGNGVTQDVDRLAFEVLKKPKILSYAVDIAEQDSLRFDIYKSADSNLDKKKDAYVHLNVPYNSTRLSIAMNVEPDDNIDMALFAPNGSVVATSTEGKGVAENITVADPQKGNWTLHVYVTKIAAPSALVDIKFELEGDDRLRIISTNLTSAQYTYSDKASIVTTIKNPGTTQKIVGIRYEIIDSYGTLKQVNYGITSVKADSEKTVRKFAALKDLPSGTYFYRVSIYDMNSAYDNKESSSFSLSSTANEKVTVRIEHSNVGDLDVSLGIFGDKEILIKGRNANDQSTSIAITKDLSELDLDTSKQGSLLYVKVTDTVKGNDGTVYYASLEHGGNFFEYKDTTYVKDLSTTIIPLFNLDSMVYIRSEGHDDKTFAWQLISLQDSTERAFSTIFYQKLFQQLLRLNATMDLIANNCVLTNSLGVVPVLCVNLSRDNYTLIREIAGSASYIGNDFSIGTFTMIEPSFFEYVKGEVPSNGLTVVSADDIFYDVYFNAELLGNAILPPYFDVLRGKALLNLAYGVETSVAIEQMTNAIADYLSSNPDDVSQVAELVAEGTSKNALSKLLQGSSKIVENDTRNQFTKWVEYYRALQVIEELKAIDQTPTSTGEAAVAYVKDYIDRNSHVADQVAPKGFDQVLSNVQVNDGSSKIYLDLVYVKQKNVVSVIKIDSELSDISSVPKEELSKIIRELVVDQGAKIVSISHGLKVAQFDKLTDRNVLVLGMADADLDIDIRVPLTGSEIKQLLNYTK